MMEFHEIQTSLLRPRIHLPVVAEKPSDRSPFFLSWNEQFLVVCAGFKGNGSSMMILDDECIIRAYEVFCYEYSFDNTALIKIVVNMKLLSYKRW